VPDAVLREEGERREWERRQGRAVPSTPLPLFL